MDHPKYEDSKKEKKELEMLLQSSKDAVAATGMTDRARVKSVYLLHYNETLWYMTSFTFLIM